MYTHTEEESFDISFRRCVYVPPIDNKSEQSDSQAGRVIQPNYSSALVKLSRSRCYELIAIAGGIPEKVKPRSVEDTRTIDAARHRKNYKPVRENRNLPDNSKSTADVIPWPKQVKAKWWFAGAVEARKSNSGELVFRNPDYQMAVVRRWRQIFGHLVNRNIGDHFHAPNLIPAPYLSGRL